jgi:hypothetical protein
VVCCGVVGSNAEPSKRSSAQRLSVRRLGTTAAAMSDPSPYEQASDAYERAIREYGFVGSDDWTPEAYVAHSEAISAAVEAAIKAERERIRDEIDARCEFIESDLFKVDGDISCVQSWAHGVDDTLDSIRQCLSKLGAP